MGGNRLRAAGGAERLPLPLRVRLRGVGDRAPRPADAAAPARRGRARAGDVVCFREGPEGAHKLTDNAPEVVRVILLSDKPTLAAAVYPDSGKIGIFRRRRLTRSWSAARARSTTSTASCERRARHSSPLHSLAPVMAATAIVVAPTTNAIVFGMISARVAQRDAVGEPEHESDHEHAEVGNRDPGRRAPRDHVADLKGWRERHGDAHDEAMMASRVVVDMRWAPSV